VQVADRKRLKFLDPRRLEQTEYHSRRLAKMGVPVAEVLAGLSDTGLSLELQREATVIVNRCYHEVREAETAVLEELFRAEHEAPTLTATLHRFTLALRGYARAEEARLWFPLEVPVALRRPMCFPPKSRDRRLLDPNWEVATCWSVPLGRKGVLQLGFRKHYPWLHRERELLHIAAERCLAAAAKARLIEELEEREAEVRRLGQRMIQIEEVERRRISQEIHDETGQSLLCIRLNLEMLESVADKDEEMRVRLRATRHLAERTVDEIRRIIAALNPEVIDKLGLAAALRQLATRFRDIAAAAVRVEVGSLPELPDRMPLVIYRLAQECLSNAARHANAKSVKVRVDAADKVLRLRVQDDGKGFDLSQALAKPGSFGLSGMQERVSLLGGRIQIQSRPRQGTAIKIELPIGS
jgi:signal transduction histidine kinase